jgi:hypothetical protein
MPERRCELSTSRLTLRATGGETHIALARQAAGVYGDKVEQRPRPNRSNMHGVARQDPLGFGTQSCPHVDERGRARKARGVHGDRRHKWVTEPHDQPVGGRHNWHVLGQIPQKSICEDRRSHVAKNCVLVFRVLAHLREHHPGLPDINAIPQQPLLLCQNLVAGETIECPLGKSLLNGGGEARTQRGYAIESWGVPTC